MSNAVDRPQRPRIKSVSEAAYRAMALTGEPPANPCGFHLPETKKASAPSSAA